MARSMAELRLMQRAQLKTINKDILIESILASKDGDLGTVSVLEDRLTAIANELSELKRAISSPESDINKKLAEMQSQMNKQAEIIAHQQRFLEVADRRERETRLVVMGVPDDQESLETATTDEDKLKKVWATIGADFRVCSHRRLGHRAGGTNGTKRPILVDLDSRLIRESILEKTKRLKEAGRPYDRIFIKRDVHPNVRKEWKRLRDAEALERDRPENAGCTIRLDTRERKLYRDDVVIDQWIPQPF